MIHNHTILPYGVLPKDVIDLGTVIGPFFLGHCFNWALYGLLVLQCYVYMLSFPNDRRYIKAVVAGVFIFDSFSIALITHAGWRVLVSHWGDVNIINDLDWTWASLPVSSGIVSAVVQHFFAFRIWKLTGKFWPSYAISFVSLGQLAFSVKTAEIAYHNKTFHYIRQLIPSLWLGGSMLADLMITGTLIVILRSAHKEGFTTTKNVIKRLMIISIETALPTTIAAAIKLGLIFSAHDNKHLFFCIVLARLYSNCMMGSLNSRSELFGGGGPLGGSAAERFSETSSSSSRGSWFKGVASKVLPRRVSLSEKRSDQIVVNTSTITQSTRRAEYDLELGSKSEMSDYTKLDSPMPSPTFPPPMYADKTARYNPEFPPMTPRSSTTPGAVYETHSIIAPPSTFEISVRRDAFQ